MFASREGEFIQFLGFFFSNPLDRIIMKINSILSLVKSDTFCLNMEIDYILIPRLQYQRLRSTGHYKAGGEL